MPPGSGCGSRAATATEPAARSSPRMIDASSVTNPCSLSAAPRPALKHRVVLEHDRRRLHGRERVASGHEHGVPGLDGPAHAVERPVMRVGGPVARPTVDHDRDFVHARQDKGPGPLCSELGCGATGGDDLPVRRGDQRPVAVGDPRLEALAVEPLGADDDGGELGRRIEVAQREIEPPGDERASAAAGADARATTSASRPPAAARAPSKAPAASAREASSEDWSRRSPTVTMSTAATRTAAPIGAANRRAAPPRSGSPPSRRRAKNSATALAPSTAPTPASAAPTAAAATR